MITKERREARRREWLKLFSGWIRRQHTPALDGLYTAQIVGPAMDRLFDEWRAWVEAGGSWEDLQAAAEEAAEAWAAAHRAALSRGPWRTGQEGAVRW